MYLIYHVTGGDGKDFLVSYVRIHNGDHIPNFKSTVFSAYHDKILRIPPM